MAKRAGSTKFHPINQPLILIFLVVDGVVWRHLRLVSSPVARR